MLVVGLYPSGMPILRLYSPSGTSSKPVSYTHLDVYKRQVHHFFIHHKGLTIKQREYTDHETGESKTIFMVISLRRCANPLNRSGAAPDAGNIFMDPGTSF